MGEPKMESIEEYQSREVPLPDHIKKEGYPGLYYFMVTPDNGVFRIDLVIKPEPGMGIIGNLEHDFKREKILDHDQAVKRAEELADGAQEVHWQIIS